MAYKSPESKREGCYYPNCDGYLAVPFCCHDPEALPALKAKLAQIETPKQWVGLTDDEIDKVWRIVDYTESYEEFRISVARAIEAKLREKNEN